MYCDYRICTSSKKTVLGLPEVIFDEFSYPSSLTEECTSRLTKQQHRINLYMQVLTTFKIFLKVKLGLMPGMAGTYHLPKLGTKVLKESVAHSTHYSIKLKKNEHFLYCLF